jgi:outer membrane lipoprotein-sorting protein
MKKLYFFIISMIFFTAVNNCYSLSVDEIVDKANKMAFYQGIDGSAQVSMTIFDEQGRTREREFIILRKNIDNTKDQKYYIYFKKPGDVRNMVFMVWKYIDKDDDRWMYLPALDLVKRIAASDKRTSFTGSHFFYEDVSGRNLEYDKHELINEDEKYFIIKNTPKDKNSVEFGYYNVWIDKNNFMPVKSEYYDKQNKKYRIIEALETKEIDGFITVTKSKAEDFKLGGYTISEFKNVKYNIGIEDAVFTERYLKQPPRKWLR